MLRFALRGPEALVGHPPFERMVAPLDEALLGEIARRREAPTSPSARDILSLLLVARDEDGRAASRPRRPRRAAHAAGRRARDDRGDAGLGGALSSRATPTRRSGSRREPGFAEAVVAETLRLRPPVPLVVRRLKAPMTIGGRALPAGATVAPCAMLVHRDPRLHADPEAFRPDRFIGGPPAGSVVACRSAAACGAASARPSPSSRRRVVLERLAQRFVMRPPGRRAERVGRRGIVLVPHRGGRVVLEPRPAPAGAGGGRRGDGAGRSAPGGGLERLHRQRDVVLVGARGTPSRLPVAARSGSRHRFSHGLRRPRRFAWWRVPPPTMPSSDCSARSCPR